MISTTIVTDQFSIESLQYYEMKVEYDQVLTVKSTCIVLSLLHHTPNYGRISINFLG